MPCVALATVESAFRHALVDAEHRDAAGELIGHRLPDERGVRRLLVGRLRDRLAVGDRRERAIGRRRQVGEDRVHQRLRADVRSARRADQREDLRRARRRRQALDQFVLRQRAGLEELLHQRFVGLRHHFDQRFARRVGGVGQVRPAPRLRSSCRSRRRHRCTPSSTRGRRRRVKFLSSPIGSWIGTMVRPSVSRSDSSVRSSDARSRSSRLTTIRRGSCCSSPPPTPSRSALRRRRRRRRRSARRRRRESRRARRQRSCRSPACRSG